VLHLRLQGLDYLRGFAIILVLVFSVWSSMYQKDPLSGLLEHNIPGQFRPGDLVFPIFLFCSGAALWFFYGKSLFAKAHFDDAVKKYFGLLLASLVISSSRFFSPFPDEVLLIAVSDILVFSALWFSGVRGLAAYAVLCALLVFAGPFLLPSFWAALISPYLGGWAAVPYYSAIVAAGALFISRAVPGRQSAKADFGFMLKWAALFALLLALSTLVIPIDKMGLSLSFQFASVLVSSVLLSMCIWAFDAAKASFPPISLLGSHSLHGWALLFFFTAGIWDLGMQCSFSPAAYLPVCALLVLGLYASVAASQAMLGMIRKRK
jgi:hypothetical protein